jgi:hypothetical protein
MAVGNRGRVDDVADYAAGDSAEAAGPFTPKRDDDDAPADVEKPVKTTRTSISDSTASFM